MFIKHLMFIKDPWVMTLGVIVILRLQQRAKHFNLEIQTQSVFTGLFN